MTNFLCVHVGHSLTYLFEHTEYISSCCLDDSVCSSHDKYGKTCSAIDYHSEHLFGDTKAS